MKKSLRTLTGHSPIHRRPSIAMQGHQHIICVAQLIHLPLLMMIMTTVLWEQAKLLEERLKKKLKVKVT